MDMGSNYTPEEWQAWKDKQKAAHKNGNGHGASLTQEALTMLPTPKATSNESQQNLAKYGPNLGMALMPDQYDWSGIVGRLLPTPRSRLEGNQHYKGRNKNNLEDVAELFGESTPQPSPDGKLF
jgi:hypothetical protein